jgi:hypothetical protein
MPAGKIVQGQRNQITISSISAGVIPRLVTAGVPRRIPLVMVGFSGS